MVGLVDELWKVGNEVRKFVNSGWPMFGIYYSGEMPRSTFDPGLGNDEFLEVDLVSADGMRLGLADFWRVSPEGMATLLRAYQEDRTPGWGYAKGADPGTWLWPLGTAREIAEMIRHACALAERFEAPETVSFRVEWSGLRDRCLLDPDSPYFAMHRVTAREDRCVFAKTVPVAGLAEGWAELTAEMLSRVLRMFDAKESVSGTDIRSWSEKFRR